MDRIKDEVLQAERITKQDGHYFFGYYDTPAWSGNDRYHLCHRVAFCNRLPHAKDQAELGYIDLSNNSFTVIAETTAWNFQQGSMLQWHPVYPQDTVIYNARNGSNYEGVVLNLTTGKSYSLERPVANVDPTGRYAVSINFPRMYDFRPGYGYAGEADPYANVLHPHDDGIYLIDLQSGKSQLTISLQEIWKFTKSYFQGEDRKILINHITFNTDGSRLIALVRCFPDTDKIWKTAIVTMNRDGSDVFLLADYGYASHYHWRDREHLVIHAGEVQTHPEGEQLYVWKDKKHEIQTIDTSFFLKDGHCSYSPDRRFMLYDSYPDSDSYRHLYINNLQTQKGIKLGSYYSMPELDGDIRCDLHPRWNREGTWISFDSTHEGQRHVYRMNLSSILTNDN
ncbi:hypothetical protein [Paenibacillus qinlingensis]|uniref:Oligogalacturonate lyase domain-containing protein n=1 Tax=Paenibacillus qinlingensis TaxID=1837343 RepID=A0ABU1NU07_9BACL|nr:hypothetical protein [Paenibacillus qinlingensis]MDR6550819.1 hypothetical protein [Paenibacillus qinlingensis]